MIAKHCVFHGNVQGVGFRYRTRQKAQEYGVAGWVKNLPDGTVEAVFEGDEESVDAVVDYCKRSISRVDRLEEEVVSVRDLNGFSIVY
ncbi:MAG: acylphosphatase [Nanoarchaeota archaeon]